MTTDREGNQAAPQRLSRRLRNSAPLLIVLGACIVVGVLWLVLPSKDREAKATPSPPVDVRVETIMAEAKMPDEFTINGSVEANRVVNVSAEVAGRVESIEKDEGAKIEKGEVVVKLNTDLLQADVDFADAQWRYDVSELERFSTAKARGVATEKELDEARTKVDMSKAQLDTVKAKLARATIAAPIDGTLNDVAVEIGEYVRAGDCVAEITDIEQVKVVVGVPEKDVQFFETGSEHEITATFKAKPVRFTSRITFISELAETAARTTRMELTVDNADRRLRSGQIVSVRLRRRVLKDVIMIPLGAVISTENGYVVYVVKAGKARRREVELGIMKGRKVQITEGLGEGDRLIVEGQRYVAPGQPVKEKQPAAAEK
ncbi:MAG: efflux RND transporter periplasmic adaptor subunit [Phycisphaerae bacterium]|nr:efflux RND transporter periplasmic adaptor subunit [Phycisphaerae bacterium]